MEESKQEKERVGGGKEEPRLGRDGGERAKMRTAERHCAFLSGRQSDFIALSLYSARWV